MGEQRKSKTTLGEVFRRKLKKWFSANEDFDYAWPLRAWYHFLGETDSGRWLRRNVIVPIEVFYEFLERLCGWIPVLWRDRDWDEQHMLYILKYKISRMRKLVQDYGHGANSKRVARQMWYAELLIERINKNDYCVEEKNRHLKKWGEFCKRKKWTDGTPVGNVWRIRQNATTRAKWQQQAQEERDLDDKERKLLASDKDRLFRHIRKYMDQWWD